MKAYTEQATSYNPRFIPPELLEAGISEVHPYPMVMDADKRPCGHRPAEIAWAQYPRVELNPPNSYAAISLDIDDPREAGFEGGKPAILPTWIVQNHANGHMHAVYALALPVHRNPESLAGPLRKVADIADRLALTLGGDPGYSGQVTRNPINPGPGVSSHWYCMFPYTLDALDKRLPKTRTAPGHRLTGIGRNCDSFAALVSEAHRPRWQPVFQAEGWKTAWLDHVRRYNIATWAPHVLPDSECRSIARSCWGYAIRQFDPAVFQARQLARNGRRWHGRHDFDFDERDGAIMSLWRLGFEPKEIAPIVELSPRTVNRRLKKLEEAQI